MKLKKKFSLGLEKSDHLHMVKVLNILGDFKENVIELENPEIYMEPN